MEVDTNCDKIDSYGHCTECNKGYTLMKDRCLRLVSVTPTMNQGSKK